ncbi:site-specific DNA-methyltransferase [Helicobacter anatolicus]|uniref:site-specific DNA-methyltransferase n=1 Tax=Helicobacter anatolicus TaxID=2905874 RepID=UPI001E50DBD5|nr:site-specific DNA-methyltransferase [Helicobacter anatolicus]MCE3038351.1 site-specific DNA-methyltransferase [Helicobacter anatolicus]
MLKDYLLQDLKNRFETLGMVRNLAQKYDEVLLKYLLEESKYQEEFKSRFFMQTSLSLIFKLNDFLNFLDLKSLGGSYTGYVSKIGLSTKTKGFLKSSNEVVLNFAFKDGVIKGSQSKDEQKSQEIFFHEILAKDEIDVLFSKKALQNFQAFGEQDLQTQLSSSPNLLIKGNNLLALHSLKSKYAKQVKLIYIDPPYNTGNDSFNYNDRFNHSTWLTFMKNRLEVAKEFLKDDGVIFVQCDDNEQAYLKVLMDEIYGRENFVNCIAVKRGTKSLNSQFEKIKTLNVGFEYILVYKKSSEFYYTNPYVKEANEKQKSGLWAGLYSNANRPTMRYEIDGINITRGQWKWSKSRGLKALQNYKDFEQSDFHDLKSYYEYHKNRGNDLEFVRRNQNNTIEYWVKPREKLIIDTNFMDLHTSGNSEIKALFLDQQRAGGLGDKKGDKGDASQVELLVPLDKEKDNLQENQKIELFATPKPEALLQRIIEISTNENDLIMDFFAGSGTTLAVAHKMHRRYIGIEQMDYIESITKERLKKVIDGEQGGISKAVKWNGGGSFVYAELMPLNALYKEKIKNSKDEKELEKIYQDLESKAFLDYRVDLEDVIKDKDFKELDLENKKEVLKLILDSNMDYLPYEDIEDNSYEIDTEVIELNRIFYEDK